VKRRAAPIDPPAQQDEGQEEEEDRRSYSDSPVEPDAEIDLASALLWDDYHETLAQFLSRLFQEISKCSSAERMFKQRIGHLLYQDWLKRRADRGQTEART
jgi:hypothetical protein